MTSNMKVWDQEQGCFVEKDRPLSGKQQKHGSGQSQGSRGGGQKGRGHGNNRGQSRGQQRGRGHNQGQRKMQNQDQSQHMQSTSQQHGNKGFLPNPSYARVPTSSVAQGYGQQYPPQTQSYGSHYPPPTQGYGSHYPPPTQGYGQQYPGPTQGYMQSPQYQVIHQVVMPQYSHPPPPQQPPPQQPPPAYSEIYTSHQPEKVHENQAAGCGCPGNRKMPQGFRDEPGGKRNKQKPPRDRLPPNRDDQRNISRTPSTFSEDDVDQNERESYQVNRGRGRGRGGLRSDRGGRNDQQGRMQKASSTVSVDGVGQDGRNTNQRSRGGIRGGKGSDWGRDAGNGQENLRRSSSTFGLDSNIENRENFIGNRQNRSRGHGFAAGRGGFRASCDDVSGGARPVQHRQNRRDRTPEHPRRRKIEPAQGNIYEKDQIEFDEEPNQWSERNRQRGSTRGTVGGKRGRGGRVNLRQRGNGRPFLQRGVGRTESMSDQSDVRSVCTLSDSEGDTDDTSDVAGTNVGQGNHMNRRMRGGRGRFMFGRGNSKRARGRGGTESQDGRQLEKRFEAQEVDTGMENRESQSKKNYRGHWQGRGRRGSFRARWRGYTEQALQNDLLKRGESTLTLDDVDSDDNASVTSEVSVTASLISEPGQLEKGNEKEMVKLDDIDTVKLTTLKNRIVRYAKKLESMKKQNENIEAIRKLESQIEEMRRVRKKRVDQERQQNAEIMEVSEEIGAKSSSPTRTELPIPNAKTKKRSVLSTKKSHMSFRPKSKVTRCKRAVASDDDEDSGSEVTETFDNNSDEENNEETMADENVAEAVVNKSTKKKRNRNRRPRKRAGSDNKDNIGSDIGSQKECEIIVSELSSKLEKLLVDEGSAAGGELHGSNRPRKESLVVELEKPLDKKEEIETRRRTDSSSHAVDTDNVDEVEVFKFLVKTLEGRGTVEEIKRESGMFPQDVDPLVWFKKHCRRFIVIGNDYDNAVVVAFYKQATYCKFYITTRSCQKECSRYHICKDFLAGCCKFGSAKCKYSHDFLDDRNVKVSWEFGFCSVFTNEDICSLMRVRYPHVCQSWNEKDGKCQQINCIGLHLCARFLLGKCLEGQSCPLNHDKLSAHNKPIIEAYGMAGWKDIMFQQIVYISRPSAHSEDHGEVREVVELAPEVEAVAHQRPGRNRVVEVVETTDIVDGKFICEAYLRNECQRARCEGIHTSTKMPYLWQLKVFGVWINLDHSEMLEKEYCDMKDQSSHFILKHSGMDLEALIKFDKEQTAVVSVVNTDQGQMVCECRRLSTASFADMDQSTSQELAGNWKTQWRWYWRDDFRQWILFESDAFQQTLEVKYLAKQPSFHYSRENYRFKYFLDFQQMNQLNIDTRKNRLLLRRPLFVSKDDVLNSRFACQLSAAPSIETPLPAGWMPWDLAHPFELVLLENGSTEYVMVSDTFYKTLDRTRQKIDAIYRLQNHKLWSMYCNQEKIMEANQRRVGNDSMVATMYLFHGTGNLDAVRGISINNFDARVSGKHATVWGDGAYFARDAKYSHSYTEPPERFIFMVKVLVGEYTRGDKSYRRPPEKPRTNHELYDSCVNDETNPTIFILFDKNQYYPEYLIQYKDTSDNMDGIVRPTARPRVSLTSGAVSSPGSSVSYSQGQVPGRSAGYSTTPYNQGSSNQTSLGSPGIGFTTSPGSPSSSGYHFPPSSPGSGHTTSSGSPSSSHSASPYSTVQPPRSSSRTEDKPKKEDSCSIQ